MATISFARGVPAPECLPVEELADCARAALERDGRTILNYGPVGGYGPLREWLAERHGIEAEMSKPVLAYIAGFTAPPGKTMGHAGAIISGSSGTAQAKKEALEASGITVGTTPTEVAQLVADRVGVRA